MSESVSNGHTGCPRVVKAPPTFNQWRELLDLIRASFAYMAALIDPPSSALRLTEAGLAEKARSEHLYLAMAGEQLIGCAFFREHEDAVYIGKVAVNPSHQRQGLGRDFLAQAEQLAHELGLQTLRLETRVQLTGNHHAFGRLGFRKVAEGTHLGYNSPTYIIMEKHLD